MSYYIKMKKGSQQMIWMYATQREMEWGYADIMKINDEYERSGEWKKVIAIEDFGTE
jgi:hypothetical protein